MTSFCRHRSTVQENVNRRNSENCHPKDILFRRTMIMEWENKISKRSNSGDIGSGNFRQRNNSTEDGKDEANGWFRRNSGCSWNRKLLEFRSKSIPKKRKQLVIPVLCNKNRIKLSEFCSEAFRGRKHTLNSVCWNRKLSF
jgi:hypothetical protein